MSTLDQKQAKRLIFHLKAGTSPIDCADFLNVGNEAWYKAAVELFDDLTQDGDSLVRFVRGYYGDGKTHFLGMLRSLAFKQGWSVSYVTAERTKLHKFEIVYAEIVQAITLPPDVHLVAWLTEPNPRGALALLTAFFSKIYLEVYGASDERGITRISIRHEVKLRVATFCSSNGFHDFVSHAHMNFTKAALAQEAQGMHDMVSWLQGNDVKFKDQGISRRIDQRIARDVLRCLTQIAQYSGIRGTLVLLDEAELIMAQSKSVRVKSYSVLRDLLDNADPQAGMRASIIYIAATPEMFTAKEGFAEYEALRSRLLPALNFTTKQFIDYRDVVIDLTRTPLQLDLLVELAKKVRDIHSVARQWDAAKRIGDPILHDIIKKIDKGASLVSKPRMVASVIAKLLDSAEQNPSQDPALSIETTISESAQTLLKHSEPGKWD